MHTTRKTSGVVSAALLGTALLWSAPALAQDAVSSGAHRHDGLFLRLDVGGGWAGTSNSDNDLTIKGGAGTLGVAVGGSLTESFSLAGHLWGLSEPSPTFSSGSSSVTPDNTTAGMGALGLEANWYLMPANVYLSVTLGLSNLSLQVGSVTAKTDVGFAGQFAVGKEWWVSDEWGIGVAGQLDFAANKDSDTSTSPTWSTLAGMLVFSATYN
jgi:hypothetical protein